jgi:integrase
MRQRRRAADSDWVFANPLTGSRITDPHRQVVNVVAKSGVPFSPHDLRRTFASIVSRLGDRLSYYTTKRLLNHRTSDVTQGYVQFDLKQLRSAMQAVEDFVLQRVTDKPDDRIHVPAANDRPSQAHVGPVTSSMQQAVAVRIDQASSLGPAD